VIGNIMEHLTQRLNLLTEKKHTATAELQSVYLPNFASHGKIIMCFEANPK